jgi:hypothetical protein
MANIFSEVVKGFEWLGKEIADAPAQVKKVLTIANDVKADAATLLPEVVTVIDDVDAVAVAAVKDGGAALSDAESLGAAIVAAAQKDGVDIASDLAVVTAFEAFIKQVTTSSNWADLVAANKKLVTDYDALGASAKAALEQLEAAA